MSPIHLTGDQTVTEKLSYSITDAARLLSLGESNIKKFIDSGDLRSFKIGARRLISLRALQEFIERSEKERYVDPPAEVSR